MLNHRNISHNHMAHLRIKISYKTYDKTRVGAGVLLSSSSVTIRKKVLQGYRVSTLLPVYIRILYCTAINTLVMIFLIFHNNSNHRSNMYYKKRGTDDESLAFNSSTVTTFN